MAGLDVVQHAAPRMSSSRDQFGADDHCTADSNGRLAAQTAILQVDAAPSDPSIGLALKRRVGCATAERSVLTKAFLKKTSRVRGLDLARSSICDDQ